jgi:hypothetical protein
MVLPLFFVFIWLLYLKNKIPETFLMNRGKKIKRVFNFIKKGS